MATIGAFEAKTHLSQLLDKVAAGERFTITRHGKPVAKLVPVTADADAVEAARRAKLEAIDKLKRMKKGTLRGLTIRQLIEDGRKN